MRGDDQQLQPGMFSYVALEDRIPADHPLRWVSIVLWRAPKEGVRSRVRRYSIAVTLALLIATTYRGQIGSPNHKTLSERALLRMIHTLREGYFQQAPKPVLGRWRFLRALRDFPLRTLRLKAFRSLSIRGNPWPPFSLNQRNPRKSAAPDLPPLPFPATIFMSPARDSFLS
jgi:hypothetical protein